MRCSVRYKRVGCQNLTFICLYHFLLIYYTVKAVINKKYLENLSALKLSI